MNDNQTKRMVDKAIDRLIAQLEEGQSDSLKAYLAAMGQFHAYSLGNVFLIKAQFPKASRVAGYCAWQKLGRYVRRGEHGIRILVPIVYRDADRGDEERVVAFRTGYVFDLSQTEGRPLPDFSRVQGDPGRHLDRLRDAIGLHGIDLEYMDTPAGVDGWSEGGRIVIRRALRPAEEFSVMVHELAHELLHCEERGSTGRSARETEAEAVAFVVAQAIGLNPGSASSDYIQLWNGDRSTLLASLERVHRTAAAVLNDLGLSREVEDPPTIVVHRAAA